MVSPSHAQLPACTHLPNAVDGTTMTTLGVPVADLDLCYGIDIHRYHPVPVGERQGATAYPVFPTWGFVHLEWSQAAVLARLVAFKARIPHDIVAGLPQEHLLARLLFASFPVDVLTNEAYRQAYWTHHIDNLFDKRVPTDRLCTQPLALERQEMADLAAVLHGHILVTKTNIGTPHPLEALLALLLHTALPEQLFQSSAHHTLQRLDLLPSVLVKGRHALPATFTIPNSPLPSLPLV